MDIQELNRLNIKDGADGIDTASANNAIMIEIGKIIGSKRSDFIDLLNESGIQANAGMSDAKLIELFVKNAPFNKELLLGASILVAINNGKVGFDGETEINDNGVKNGYVVMQSYFSGDEQLEEPRSNAVGLGGITAAIGQGAKFGSDLIAAKRNKQYGVTDSIQKQVDAKNAIAQQVLAQRQAEIEALSKDKASKDKTKRTTLIVGGIVGAIVVLGGIFYILKSK